MRPSSLTELEYPDGTGSSGDVTTGLLGYGYDARGFIDTISIKAKVIDMTLVNENNIYYGRPIAGFVTLVSGASFKEMYSKFWNIHSAGDDSLALARHIRSLLKLAYNTEVPESEHSYVYYAIGVKELHYKLHFVLSELPSLTTTGFKNDVTTLSTENLISKYGTHVLTDVFNGSKMELLYSGDFNRELDDYNLEQAFLYRRDQFFGSAPHVLFDGKNPSYTASDEQIIFNTIGSKLKICGLINVTDYNPDNIYIDTSAPFGGNYKVQFMSIGEDGLIPLYELISDPSKKQEIKSYIHNYLVTGLPL